MLMLSLQSDDGGSEAASPSKQFFPVAALLVRPGRFRRCHSCMSGMLFVEDSDASEECVLAVAFRERQSTAAFRETGTQQPAAQMRPVPDMRCTSRSHGSTAPSPSGRTSFHTAHTATQLSSQTFFKKKVSPKKKNKMRFIRQCNNTRILETRKFVKSFSHRRQNILYLSKSYSL